MPKIRNTVDAILSSIKENAFIIPTTLLLMAMFGVLGVNWFTDWWDERRLREAYALGFFSVQEMKELQQQGYKTRSDYRAALKKEADALAIKAEDEARSLGFDNAEEMKNLRRSGFRTKAQYESFLAENEKKIGKQNKN